MKRTLILAVLAALFLVFSDQANATHLQNANSSKCLTSGVVQSTCAATDIQDIAFDPVIGGKYQLRIGSQCFNAAGSSIGSSINFTTCSSTSAMNWKLYRANSGSTTRQFQNDLGNCLGITSNSTSNSASAQMVDCTALSAEWSMGIEFVYSQNSSLSTVPVFAISSNALGNRVTGVTAAVNDQCTCDVFSSGVFCALVANTAHAATCRSYSSRVVASNQPLSVTTRTAASSIPTLASVRERTDMGTSGRIDAVNGQTIENLRISATVGPCIYIAAGVHDVTIRNNEIGPCTQAVPPAEDHGITDFALFITDAGDNIIVEKNVFHDASTMIFMTGGQSIVVDRNWFGNPLGPSWAGATVQLANTVPGATPSKVTCNIFDGRYQDDQVRSTFSVDKVNLGGSLHGTSGTPFEVAYNRILGPSSGGDDSGSGFQIGDLLTTAFEWINIHHNTIVYSNGGGITISGGNHVTLDNNLVDSRGENTATNTGVSFNWSTYYPERAACTNLTVTNNRGMSRLWYYTATGDDYGFANAGDCTSVTNTGNNFGDTSLTGIDLFNTPYSECEE